MLLNAALALPVEERAAYVEVACARDSDLRLRVTRLFRAHERAGAFLQEPAREIASERSTGPISQHLCRQSPDEKSGTRIGRYTLLEQIGEGGCGIVYKAAQEEPVRREVALKIIKLGMDTKSVVARFEMERQALAMMEHPNIAKVLDAGATDSGRPFFVMELVRGLKVTDYCNQNQLSMKERLDLFVQICSAVQHAHQKGIIHRDLKPSNILVTVQEPHRLGIPKVIDFGIAKATQGRLTDDTAFTAVEQFVGTPAYMSPEQAGITPNGASDVDTRSDIYSLGILLYELLTGQTPFDAKELREACIEKLRRTIQEQEPVRPSSRLTGELAAAARRDSSATAPEALNKTRRLQQLIHAVKGDLDWIVMKCLEKDRTRRYGTANGLAADIERHLKNEPISARPPGNIYSILKFGRRNRGALAVGGALGMGMVAALIVLAIGNVRIRNERNQRDLALKEKGAALDAARSSEDQARNQLFISLNSQAHARRYSGHIGQRIESLSALAEAARIRPVPALRDEAIAAMAIPDIRLDAPWRCRPDGPQEVVFDPLYQQCARVDGTGIITIRSIPEYREIIRLSGLAVSPGEKTPWLLFGPESRFLAETLVDGRLQIWQLTEQRAVFPYALSNFFGVCFSPDGKVVAAAQSIVESAQKTNYLIKCFDLSNGVELRSWHVPHRVFSLAFAPDNRRLAAGYFDSRLISVLDLNALKPIAQLPIEHSSEELVTWHPGGRHLAAAGSDPRIQIWDVEAKKLAAVLQGHSQQVICLSFHPRGELLASSSWDNVFRLWQPTPGRQLMQIRPAGQIQFSSDGRWAGVFCPTRDQAQRLEVHPSEEYHTFIGGFGVSKTGSYDGDLSGDGRLLAMGSEDGVRLWDVSSGVELVFLPLDSTLSVLFEPDGKSLLTCGPESGLQEWPIEMSPRATNPVLGMPHRFNLPLNPWRAAMSDDPNTVAIVDERSGQAAILNLATRELKNLRFAHPYAGYVAISPNGKRLATSGWHAEGVRLWNAQTGELIKYFAVGKYDRASFTPDSKDLIISLSDEFRFVNLRTLQVDRSFHRELGLYAGEIAFSQDMRLMAFELEPGIIDLKEFSSGKTVARFEDPNGDLSTWAAFTPDGTQLISAARYADAIHRWDFRAIRVRLKALGLDWDWPEFAPATAK
jgi:serine/threonine protein kinase